MEIGFAASSARIDTLKLMGEPYPRPAWTTGLIDTGAGISAVGGDVITALGLKPIGKIDVYSAVAGGIRTCNLYDICISLVRPPASAVMQTDMPIIEGTFTGKKYNALIGRDILRSCLFFYNGPANVFTLAF